MKITVIGLGYVGLPTAALLASNNIEVNGFDIDHNLVTSINKGESQINEPKLNQLIRKNVNKNYLKAFTTPQIADVYILAVPTPINKDFSADLSHLENAFKSIMPLLKSNDLIIIESTCPVGTSERMIDFIFNERKDLRANSNESNKILNVNFAYCPERVLPGNAIDEMINNHRIIGSDDLKSSQKAKSLYQLFSKGKLLETDLKTAEMVKLTENSFRDVNIAFANELSQISDKLNIDVFELIKLSNFHPRINILNPGIGVGGHCIAIDPYFLINLDKNNTKLISTARFVNTNKTIYITNQINSKIEKFYKKNKKEKLNIVVLGLSYKPNVSDFRESPAIKVLNNINRSKVNDIFLVEPHLKSLREVNVKNKDQLILSSLKKALNNYDLLIILVKHKQFNILSNLELNQENIFDAVGIFNKNAK